MKLDQLFKANRPGTAGTSAAAFQSDAVFQQIKDGMKADPSTAKKLGGVYQFEVTGNGGKKTWTVNLKADPPSVEEGAVGKAEVNIALADADLVNMVSGKANGQQLFMGGKLKIKGNMALAMKLDQLFKANKPGVATTAGPFLKSSL